MPALIAGVCAADTAVNIFVIWNDADNVDQSRPPALNVQVLNGGTPVETVSIMPDAEQLWRKTVNITGEVSSLSVTSGEATGYTRRTPIIKENTITLIYDHTPVVSSRTVGNILQVEVTVNKTWAGVPAAFTRHPDVVIVLLVDGVEKERKPLGPQGNVKFENLPLYENVSSTVPIVYSVTEELTGNWVRISENEWINLDGLAKYTASVSQNGREWTLTNTFSWMQNKLDIPVEKIWKDEGTRPTSVTLGLFTGIDSVTPLKTVELTAGDNWKGKFADLPIRDSQGNRIDYSSCVVKEKMGDSWITSGGMIQLDGKTYQFKE